MAKILGGARSLSPPEAHPLVNCVHLDALQCKLDDQRIGRLCIWYILYVYSMYAVSMYTVRVWMYMAFKSKAQLAGSTHVILQDLAEGLPHCRRKAVHLSTCLGVPKSPMKPEKVD